ncbi:MAG: ATP-dependent DNA helicase [Erysipelotrichaceae bacterium]|nr:ATP-dependent DNA helicase [Erysipelotrichaceae bacterium]
MDLSSLNKEQLESVISKDQYLRVVAGAGSGKTRVLTYRIANLIVNENVVPRNIMAVTFTNKAAKEIKERVISLIGDVRGIFLGTIHSWCARFLRFEARYIDYPDTFTIIDEEDQLNIMKGIFANKGLPKSDPNIKGCLEWIGNKKTNGYQYEDLKNEKYHSALMMDYLDYFRQYTEILRERKSLDFDDLLLKSIEILADESNGVRERYSRYMEHILVDEFQDINDVQFRLITLLMTKDTSLYVVGDPDQTIYTWRGANHRLILDLEENLNALFKGAKVKSIVLNRNYRSTKSILNCANKLIDFNKERVKKDLFSYQDEGQPVNFYNARTVKEEAFKVVSNIMELHTKKNVDYSNIAVLYRANYLSREVESQLSMYRIPYKVFGGMKFYQRKEIKDIVAYLKLIVNPSDDTAFERIVNVPKRGIGPTSLERLANQADALGQMKFIYLKENINESPLTSKQKASWIGVLDAMDKVSKKLEAGERKIASLLEDFVDKIGYFKYLIEEEENYEDRIDNIKELVSYAEAFLEDDPNAKFEDFVNNAMLQSSQDDVNNGDFVSLMTVHTAKGLEYDYVFVYGMGEGVFPSMRAISESKLGIEEERRLAYVAFTRAKLRLYVSSNQDYSYVLQCPLSPSRFVKEAGIYKDTYEDKYRMGHTTSSYYQSQNKKPTIQSVKTILDTSKTNGVKDWKVGDRIEHVTFGKGKVVQLIDKLIVVQFDNVQFGKKTFLGSHISIKRI